MAALELSMDFDWVRPKFSFFWASGDDKPLDGRGRGFDSIIDNPNFAGGGFSYWVRQGIPLPTSGLELTGRNSLLPALRSSKIEGQPNYINPGLFLFGIGADFERHAEDAGDVPGQQACCSTRPQPLQALLFQDRVRNDVGWDLSLGLRWRPLLIDNIIVNVGGATFIGGAGFKRHLPDEGVSVRRAAGSRRQSSSHTQILYSGFLSVTLTY